jgi:hypothetical protein
LCGFKWPILFALIAIALNIAAVVSMLGVFRKSGISFFAPGEASITITKPGHYTLWYEISTFIDGQFMSFPENLPSGTSIKILKQPEGAAVPLHSGGFTSMEAGSARRVSVGQLTFSSPGQYQVAVTGFNEKRAFYLDDAKLIRSFMNVMVCGLLSMLFALASIGSAAYVLTHQSMRGG